MISEIMDVFRKWKFPVDTCEKKYYHHNSISQIYSVIVNLLIVLMICYQLSKSKSVYISLFFISIIVFEILHALSHYGNYENMDTAVHMSSYFLLLSLFLALRSISGKELSNVQGAILLILLCIDIYIFLKIKGFYMVLSLILIHLLLIFFYYDYMPAPVRNYLPYIVLLILLVTILFVNEAINCKKMMAWKVFPYHAVIESFGFLVFYFYTEMFLNWKR